MKTFLSKTVRFLKSDDGPTAVEYAILLALIIVACLASISLLAERTGETFQYSSDEIEAHM